VDGEAQEQKFNHRVAPTPVSIHIQVQDGGSLALQRICTRLQRFSADKNNRAVPRDWLVAIINHLAVRR
jgi:hypothetical protein